MTSKGTRLSGDVRSIRENGSVELATKLSPDPLLLKSDAVAKISFSEQADDTPVASALVELTNGDYLPVSIESMDDQKLVAISPDAGRLEIPRALLKSMQIGVQNHKIIYKGPMADDEWQPAEASKKWNFDNGSLSTEKSSFGSKTLNLPERFILRFTLEWEANAQPNFKITFADPLLPIGKKVDRYFMTFNSAGILIQREASKDEEKHYNRLRSLNRLPKQFPNHELRVELRVNRKTKRIRLFIDDVEENEIPDPIAKAPMASGISFEAHASGNSLLKIRDIEVLEDDDSHSRHRNEKRGDDKNDSIISTEDERWSGSLTRIQPGPNGTVFSFKSDFQKEALEIPETAVSTVFFKSPDQDAPAADAPPFVLILRGGGSLSLSSCVLTDAIAAVKHPLLGPLEIRRNGVTDLIKAANRKSPLK
jgi:hypothetical protein